MGSIHTPFYFLPPCSHQGIGALPTSPRTHIHCWPSVVVGMGFHIMILELDNPVPFYIFLEFVWHLILSYTLIKQNPASYLTQPTNCPTRQCTITYN
jgi:hypothetical protein